MQVMLYLPVLASYTHLEELLHVCVMQTKLEDIVALIQSKYEKKMEEKLEDQKVLNHVSDDSNHASHALL